MTVQPGLCRTGSEPKLLVFSRTGSFLFTCDVKALISLSDIRSQARFTLTENKNKGYSICVAIWIPVLKRLSVPVLVLNMTFRIRLSLSAPRSRLKKLQKLIHAGLNLDQSTIAEIKGYSNPPRV